MTSEVEPDTTSSRVWLITGCSQGLGRALLEEVLGRGERAVATARNPKSLASLKLAYPSEQLLIVSLDVTETTQIDNAFDATRKHFGRLDVVVNNAGYGIQGEIEATPDVEARRMMETLFWGPVRVTQQAIPFMRDINPPGQGGCILNISSVGGYIGNATRGFYNSAKFALEGFTEAFTKEMLPEWNIKGVIVEPGGFNTEWSGSSMVHVPMPEAYNRPDAPSVLFRQMTQGKSVFVGDPRKAARALVEVAGLLDPPIRVQLGTDAYCLVRRKAEKTLEDCERWVELARSTDADGVDEGRIMEKLGAVNVRK